MYFIRVLIDPVHFVDLAPKPKRQNKRELRRSLGTKNPDIARRISFQLNALLEGAETSRRETIVDDFFAHSVCAWTLPGGVQANDPEDQRRLSQFLKDHPLIEHAIAARIAGMPLSTPQTAGHADVHDETKRTLPSHLANVTIPAVPQIVVSRPSVLNDGPPHRQREQLPPNRWPKNPLRLAAARATYLAHYKGLLKTQSDRTSIDNERLLEWFADFLNAEHSELGEDPWVHDLDSSHVTKFLSEHAERAGKRKNADGMAMSAAPRTMVKKLRALCHFFDHQCRTAKSTTERVSEDLKDAAVAWSLQAQRENVHYLPFTDDHIKHIFAPRQLLENNRDPDYFWCPFLALYLGVRLGDVVDAKLSDIGHIAAIDTWYIEVPVDRAKNKNSVRRLPITQPLIDLGFLDYVEHVRRLDAKYLFPNRDWDAPTYQHDPSKNQSRKFGQYLDKLDIKDRLLVFHSFRHTLISVMQDAGVPLGHAMQIAGHEAQEHAVRTKRVTEAQARSVHLSVYTHAELERLGTEYPLLTLRQHLERSMKPPVDVPRLKKAAAIVLQHVKKAGGKFRSGWPPQRTEYTESLLAQLER